MKRFRLLRKTFAPRRGEVIVDWEKLHSEELHDLCSSKNVIQLISDDQMGRECGTRGEEEKCIQSFVGET